MGQNILTLTLTLGMGQNIEDLMSGSPSSPDMVGLGGGLMPSSHGDHGEGGNASSNATSKPMPIKKAEGKADPLECPPQASSPAQRIKRDRAASLRQRGMGQGLSVGSEPIPQRMRQGPGPGSVKSDDVLGWSVSPGHFGLLDEDIEGM